MSDSEKGRARAVADLAEGLVLATVEIAAPAKRVLSALSSEGVIHWWVRSGVFDARKWNKLPDFYLKTRLVCTNFFVSRSLARPGAKLFQESIRKKQAKDEF